MSTAVTVGGARLASAWRGEQVDDVGEGVRRRRRCRRTPRTGCRPPRAPPRSGRNTDTMPGNSWPMTSARRMPRPRTATSWEVMPPLATTQAGWRRRARLDHLDDRGGDGAGNGQAVVGVAAAEQGAAGEQQHVGGGQGRGDLPADLGDVRVAPLAGRAGWARAVRPRSGRRVRCALATCRLVSPTCEPTTTRPWPPGLPARPDLGRRSGGLAVPARPAPAGTTGRRGRRTTCPAPAPAARPSTTISRSA